jgi:hypothetical protein
MSIMHVFFDVDYTICSVDFGLLRPHVEQVFETLHNGGHSIYIWSGAGDRTMQIESFGLTKFVSGFFPKPTDQYERSVRQMLDRGRIPVLPDLIVDDSRPIVRALGGIVVVPYGGNSLHDNEMKRVCRIVTEYSGRRKCSSGDGRPYFPAQPVKFEPRRQRGVSASVTLAGPT